jgi:putative ABC transport system permease protein
MRRSSWRSFIDDSARDLSHGLRLLRRNPAFAATVLITMAIAVGATVTVFSLVDAWLLEPLNFPESSRLVIGFGAQPARPSEPAVWLPYRAYLGWKERSRSFGSLSGVFFRDVTVQSGLDASSALGFTVTPDFFTTLGVAPLRGRTLSDEDVRGPRVVVLSYGLWQRHFGGSPDIVGRSIRLSDIPHDVVGIMPRDFDIRILDIPEGAAFWTALRADEAGYEPTGFGPVAIVGRLRPPVDSAQGKGVTIASAQSEVAAITREIESRYPINLNSFVVTLSSLHADNTRTIRSTLLTVLAAVAGLLLIAGMNISTLILGRGLGRWRETAIRAAIGSGRARLVRQFLTEALLMSLLGGCAGVLLAVAGTRLFVAWNPLGTLPPNGIGLDWRALVASGVAVAFMTAVCGLVPALRASRADANGLLRAVGGRGSSSMPGQRVQGVMLIAQLAASIVLLVATTLLIRTFERLQAAPLGFGASDLSIANVELPHEAFTSSEARNAFYRQLADRLRATPGVRAVAASTSLPLNSGPPVTVNTTAEDSTRAPRISAQAVTTEFFETLRIPLIAGRTFDARDTAASPAVVLLDARAAADLFGGAANALGRRVRLDRESWREVIGVVGNVGSTFFNTLEWRTDPIIYRPSTQAFASASSPTSTTFAFHLHMRADRPLGLADVRNAAAAINARAAVTGVVRAPELIARATRQPAFRMMLLSGFAVVSLLLAAIGTYGLMAQAIANRVREIAIRLALGAEPPRVMARLMRNAFVMGAIGVTLGIVAAFWAGRTLEAMLYGVGSRDPASYITAAVALLTTTLVAAFVPAVRILRIDPALTLRSE